MATTYSDQRANDVAVPPVPNSHNTKGKVKRAYFSLNTTDTPVSDGDTVELCKVPVNARIVGGFIVYGAMGASATAIIGIAGDTNRYMASEDVSAAGSEAWANVEAEAFGDVLTQEETIILTAGGANYAADKNILGYIEYISAGE
jgi:hypothetical protein